MAGFGACGDRGRHPIGRRLPSAGRADLRAGDHDHPGAVRPVAARRDAVDHAHHPGQGTRPDDLGLGTCVAPAQRADHAALGASSPVAVASVQPLLRLRARPRARLVPGLAVHPPPFAVPGRADDAGSGHGSLPGSPARARGAAAHVPGPRVRRPGPALPPVGVQLARHRAGRSALRHAVGPHRLGGPHRGGGLADQPQPLALAGRGAPGGDRSGGHRHRQPLAG